MTKAEIENIATILISNIVKLQNTKSIHEVFFLYDVIKEQLDELHVAKVDYLGDI